MRHSSTRSINSIENLSSQIERDRIYHFQRYQSSNEGDIDIMLRTSRPYSQMEFNRSESSRQEMNNSCEFIPASNMIRHETLFHGIPLYIDRNVTLTNLMIDQSKQLTWLLSGLAKQVFHMSASAMHLFRDIDSGKYTYQMMRIDFLIFLFSARIAFNSNGSLFFNLRYFEQVFADDLRFHLPNASSSIPIVRTLVNFYFIVACHELAHNIDSSHDLNFINHLERVLVKFMDAKEAFLFRFSF